MPQHDGGDWRALRVRTLRGRLLADPALTRQLTPNGQDTHLLPYEQDRNILIMLRSGKGAC